MKRIVKLDPAEARPSQPVAAGAFVIPFGVMLLGNQLRVIMDFCNFDIRLLHLILLLSKCDPNLTIMF